MRKIPTRQQVKTADTWDLSSLFPDDGAWEQAYEQFQSQIAGYEQFRGKLGSSAATLAACLKFDSKLDELAERLGSYAHLKTTEDQANSDYQRMLGRFEHAATLAAQAASFMRPEIMQVPAAKMKKMLAATELKPYRLLIERVLRSTLTISASTVSPSLYRVRRSSIRSRAASEARR